MAVVLNMLVDKNLQQNSEKITSKCLRKLFSSSENTYTNSKYTLREVTTL